jgi:hypothetical protein
MMPFILLGCSNDVNNSNVIYLLNIIPFCRRASWQIAKNDGRQTTGETLRNLLCFDGSNKCCRQAPHNDFPPK